MGADRPRRITRLPLALDEAIKEAPGEGEDPFPVGPRHLGKERGGPPLRPGLCQEGGEGRGALFVWGWGCMCGVRWKVGRMKSGGVVSACVCTFPCLAGTRVARQSAPTAERRSKDTWINE